MGKYQKNIEAARRITVMQYLETYHPGELVRKTDREYCTRTHDSLIITPANRFFHWFSRHVGGNKLSDQGGGHGLCISGSSAERDGTGHCFFSTG